MGLDIKDGASPEETASQVAEALAAFEKQVGQKTLRELGVKEEDLARVAQRAFDEHMWGMSPREPNPDEMLDILKTAYSR